MKFRIHFEHHNGTEDSIIIEADTIEEIRAKAKLELEPRLVKNAWSEEIK